MARAGLLTAMALALHIFESFIPLPLPMPGVKLGLANLVTLYALIYLGLKDSLFIVTSRCLLGSFFAGNPASFIFSYSGALLSCLLMYFLHNHFAEGISLPAISVAGGIMHNAGQLLAAGLIIENFKILYYLPFLTVSGAIMGLFIGLTAGYTLPFLRNEII